MYILQSEQIRSNPFQLLSFLLNIARLSHCFKRSGNAGQGNEPRKDTDSIPYVVVLTFGKMQSTPTS